MSSSLDLPRRPRRLRQNESFRNLVKETFVLPEKLIAPLFIAEGKKHLEKHPQVPGILTASLDQLPKLTDFLIEKRVQSLLLFGVSDKKDERGSGALKESSALVKAIEWIRKNQPKLLIATDIALDPYTSHGHDGLYQSGRILNDETVEMLSKMSLLHARAGAHIVAPSDMMDGRIAAIRDALDDEDFEDVAIMAYTAKYASALYGPFRDTLNSHVKGDKKTYQMDPANRREALVELSLDLSEGADFVMVKPATWYLDIISDFKQNSDLPVVAYQVSGECAMIELGVKQKLFDRTRAVNESLLSIHRAGADLIVTYFAWDGL